jgi:hypothetical protein
MCARACVAERVPIGIFSINVHIPTNNHQGDRYYVFGIVIAITVGELACFFALVRWWWSRAKKKQWI